MRYRLRPRPLAALRSFERSLGRAKTSLDYKRKIDAQLRSLASVLPAEAFAVDTDQARRFLRERFPGYRDVRWHRFYSAASGRREAAYLPEDAFYFHVLPQLNPPERWSPYLDKNLLQGLGVRPMASVVARVVRGRLVDEARRPLDRRRALERAEQAGHVVVKPARGSGSGRGVRRLPASTVATLLDELLAGNGDWLLEVALEQHPRLAALNPASINTYRVLTVRVDSVLHVASTVVRVGRRGAVVDNFNAGGLVVGVDASGALAAHAHGGDGVPLERHPDHGYAFADTGVVPASLAHEAALAVHDAMPDMDLVSCDVAMVPGPRAVLLEVNVSWQGITMHQLCHGPLLGALQAEVVRPVRVRTVLGLVV